METKARLEQLERLDRKCWECKVIFGLTLAVSVGLIIGGFCVPPTGQIDGSVLTAVGELFGFAALASGLHAIRLGYDFRIVKGDTEVQLTDGPAHHPHHGHEHEMEGEE